MSRAFDVDRRLIGQWVLIRDKIEEAKFKRTKSRIKHLSTYAKYPKMEELLYAYIINLRDENKIVSGSLIKHEEITQYQTRKAEIASR